MSMNLGNKEIMAKNIKYYMELHNLSRKELCKAIGVKYTTFTDWVNGNVYPRIDKIELMANYFGISKSDLVEPHGKSLVVTEAEYDLIAKIRKMDAQSKNVVTALIEMESNRHNSDHLIKYSNRITEGELNEREHNTEEKQ